MNREARQTPATVTPQTVVTEPDGAKYIGFSRAWMRQARMRGRGPAFLRIGRAIRYRIADLDAWLESHRVRTDAA